MVTRPFSEFPRRMRARGDEVRTGASVIVRKAALVIDQALVFSTPVDKGVARSNWRVSIGEPLDGVIDAYAPGEKLGLSETQNAQAAIADGESVIGRHRQGESIAIANNLPYIERLNQGWSRQAPAGFINTSVAAAVTAVGASRVLTENGPTGSGGGAGAGRTGPPRDPNTGRFLSGGGSGGN
jgi:hypothetical protein